MPCWCSLQKQHLRLLWEQWELKGSPFITWNHIFRFVVIIISTNRALSSTYLCLLNGHDDPKKGRGERWSCLRLKGVPKILSTWFYTHTVFCLWSPLGLFLHHNMQLFVSVFTAFPVLNVLFLQKYRLGKQSCKESTESSKDGIYLKSLLSFFIFY